MKDYNEEYGNCKETKAHKIVCYIDQSQEPLEFDTRGVSLLDAIRQQGISLRAECGGRGTCGKCRIKLLEGELDISSSDRAVFTSKELEEGYRLSCRAYPKEDCVIRMEGHSEKGFDVIASRPSEHLAHNRYADEEYAIAIDIGTTTLALSLIAMNSRAIMNTYTTVNRQRAYGADVISRMKASNEGKREQLRDSIRKDLLVGIREIIATTGVLPEQLRTIAIAANTTMLHLLMGYSCETLGRYPYTPVNISLSKLSFYDVFATRDYEAEVILLPGISTYVGADIVAGLLACKYDQAKRPCLFIDLGTNGEMAVGSKNGILVCSTAAGPAFEGGNITCGTGSIAGAISSIAIREGRVRYHTIQDKAPVGICGTGILELAYELLKIEWMDETGLLCEPYFEEGIEVARAMDGKPITFLQKDIRELQLAKAAIRAGVEILLRKAGIPYDDIETVYLAGGFGYKMDVDKAVAIGLLPDKLSDRIKAVGNSSLEGAIDYLCYDKADHWMTQLLEISREIQLSEEEEFQELYIEHMNFHPSKAE